MIIMNRTELGKFIVSKSLSYTFALFSALEVG